MSSIASNYRPISLLPTTLILFEKIMTYYLKNYLVSNNLLSDTQFGFLSNRSTQLQLIQFYRQITKALDLSFKSDIIYLDMAKAFDKVDCILTIYVFLNNIKCYTDLWIIINNKLDFSFHINKICKKAYNVTNILFRCFSTVNFKFILKAFITYVRPIVEYNSSLWNPSKRNSMNCVKLEKVQRRFTKRLFSICNLGLIMIIMLGYLNLN